MSRADYLELFDFYHKRKFSGGQFWFESEDFMRKIEILGMG